MTIRNLSSKWVGDYQSAGVTSITIKARNNGDGFLRLRIALGSTVNVRNGGVWFSSSEAQIIAPHSDWQVFTFPLNTSSMTLVEGSGSFESLFENIGSIRILSSTVPSARGDILQASIELDDITTNIDSDIDNWFVEQNLATNGSDDLEQVSLDGLSALEKYAYNHSDLSSFDQPAIPRIILEGEQVRLQGAIRGTQAGISYQLNSTTDFTEGSLSPIQVPWPSSANNEFVHSLGEVSSQRFYLLSVERTP